ncbi:cupin domain-containing protein [Streptomyces sp. NPDC001553]|uniref:cupin domain-containing protein n=1 Tax=Streptomyces sp. NPDC001553 TaxID=3154385 RepID=UPI003318F2B0
MRSRRCPRPTDPSPATGRHGQRHRSRGPGRVGRLSTPWSAGHGAEFPYKPAATDTFHVIEGEAELETPDGEKIELVAGGIYSFTAGFTATWRTRSPFMKFFVVG